MISSKASFEVVKNLGASPEAFEVCGRRVSPQQAAEYYAVRLDKDAHTINESNYHRISGGSQEQARTQSKLGHRASSDTQRPYGVLRSVYLVSVNPSICGAIGFVAGNARAAQKGKSPVVTGALALVSTRFWARA